jgi:mannose/cellobiose epimerase-like protein (N-acyl-D-glucosamine 2-epimerase family)
VLAHEIGVRLSGTLRPLQAARARLCAYPELPMTPTEFVRWMRDTALPFFAQHGRDETGWFHERLTPQGTPELGASQRIRVQFRQIYTYAHAKALGWSRDGDRIALHCFHRVMELAHAPDGRPGFVHRLRPDAAVEDPLRDAYDHAFAVLALAWLSATTGDAAVRQALDATLTFVDDHLMAADGSLYEGVPPSLPRRQNPQMHWFEAMLALKSAAQHASADQRLEQARQHFRRMYEPASGLIGEYFDDDWHPAPGAASSSVEPGHLAEWAWLLRQEEKLTGRPKGPEATALLASAHRWADPATGLLVDEAGKDGAVRKATRRLWLQTELVKAEIAAFEAGEARAKVRAEAAIAAMGRYYLRQPFEAGWHDQLDADARPIAGPVQTSILYHLFVAAVETERVLVAPSVQEAS